MIYAEDQSIKLGGVILPGVVKKMEIKAAALIEEMEVEGSSVKPKQAIGYEDAKITIELIIDDTAAEKSLRKVERIQGLFRKSGQIKPLPLPIVAQETSAAKISTVLFKDFNYTLTNKTDQYTCTLELWEYIPMTITATSGKSQNMQQPQLAPDYSRYLENQRGTAPKQTNKTAFSPVFDNMIPAWTLPFTFK